MATHDSAKAIERMRKALERRPQPGMSAETPAVARWERGLPVVRTASLVLHVTIGEA